MMDTYTPEKVLNDPKMGKRMTTRPIFIQVDCDLGKAEVQQFLASTNEAASVTTFKQLSIKETAILVRETGEQFMQNGFFLCDWVNNQGRKVGCCSV